MLVHSSPLLCLTAQTLQAEPGSKRRFQAHPRHGLCAILLANMTTVRKLSSRSSCSPPTPDPTFPLSTLLPSQASQSCPLLPISTQQPCLQPGGPQHSPSQASHPHSPPEAGACDPPALSPSAPPTAAPRLRSRPLLPVKGLHDAALSSPHQSPRMASLCSSQTSLLPHTLALLSCVTGPLHM